MVIFIDGIVALPIRVDALLHPFLVLPDLKFLVIIKVLDLHCFFYIKIVFLRLLLVCDFFDDDWHFSCVVHLLMNE